MVAVVVVSPATYSTGQNTNAVKCLSLKILVNIKNTKSKTSRIALVKASCRANTVTFLGRLTCRPLVCCSCSCIQPQSYCLSLSAVCKNHSALKDLRNSAIVLNLNGFRARRTDGCAHSQIRRSIVQNLLFSLFSRTLSFSHRCLLWPLYHCTPPHTFYNIHSNTQPEAHCFTLFHRSPALPFTLNHHRLSLSI